MANTQPSGGKRIGIIGAGSWGTALAIQAARNRHQVTLWAREEEVARGIQEARRNPFYLSQFDLPEAIRATTSIEEAIVGAEFAIIVVPSHAMREVLGGIRELLEPATIIISATKGVENVTLMRMSELVADVLKDRFEPRFV